jgi:hypothetical protein
VRKTECDDVANNGPARNWWILKERPVQKKSGAGKWVTPFFYREALQMNFMQNTLL